VGGKLKETVKPEKDKNAIMGLKTMNDGAGEGQQQFI
jgi:hypothetical protein